MPTCPHCGWPDDYYSRSDSGAWPPCMAEFNPFRLQCPLRPQNARSLAIAQILGLLAEVGGWRHSRSPATPKRGTYEQRAAEIVDNLLTHRRDYR